MTQLKKGITVYLPDTRAVEIARYGIGNLKIGMGVYTFSRRAGKQRGTCPGSTTECEDICYAKRIDGAVRDVYERNAGPDVPAIPDECQILRIHISGDFDSIEYIEAWIARLSERPDVTAWAYTRSWRVPALLPSLERLRVLPNMQLFASMDSSHTDTPPTTDLRCISCGESEDNWQHLVTCPDDAGAHDYRPRPWRRAWIDGDPRAGGVIAIEGHGDIADGPGKPFNRFDAPGLRNKQTFDGTMSLVCPEETKHRPNCLECGYCFEGQKNDVTFLRH